MMSQSTNLTRLKTPKDSELLLQQWASFDSLKYMRATRGIDKTIIEDIVYQIGFTPATLSASAYYYKIMQPGRMPSDIDMYRNINLESLIFTEDDKISLSAFPFSLIKSNIPPTTIPLYSDLDRGKISDCMFSHVNLKFNLAMHAVIEASNFVNCDISYANWSGTRIRNCLFENSSLRNVILNLSTIISSVILWQDTRIVNCDLSGIHAPHARFDRCIFHKCKINNAIFNTYKIGQENWKSTIISECEINKSEMSFGNLRIINSDLSNSRFRNYQGDPAGVINAENTIFTNSQINHSEIANDCKNNRFINCYFIGSLTIRPDADISGSDFTGSNLNAWYATKAALKATGCKYDERTIWVDGTPL